VEKGANFINCELEETKQKFKAADSIIQKLSKQCKHFQNTIEKLELKNVSLEANANELEARSMRENLLFHEIEKANGENCEALVKTFIKTPLTLKTRLLWLYRAHLIGEPNSNEPRPTMATELRNAGQSSGSCKQKPFSKNA
jgi:septal ring factor EnvC (AmiA/AmiB activator)